MCVVNVLDQAEVGHLDAPADQQQVLGLDVQVLQRVLLVHVVERVGRVAHVRQQLVAGNARQLLLAALLEAVLQAAVGQLGDDQQLPVDDLDPLQRQQERMPHALDAVEGLQLAGRAVFVEQAIDELDRLDQLARRFGRPDLAIAARADPLDELVARNRLVRRFFVCWRWSESRAGIQLRRVSAQTARRRSRRHLEVWHTTLRNRHKFRLLPGQPDKTVTTATRRHLASSPISPNRPMLPLIVLGIQPSPTSPLLQPVDDGRGQNHQPQHDFLRIAADAHQVHAVLDHGDEQRPEQRAEHPALAAGKRSAADDHGRDHLQLVRRAVGRRRRCDTAKPSARRPARPAPR